MHAVITFTKEDLLTNSLFVGSKSERVQHNKRRGHIVFTVFSAFFAVLFYFQDNSYWMWCFAIASVLFLLFFPYLQNHLYKKQYNKFAEERYKAIKDSPFDITFSTENISYKSSFSDVTIKTSQIESITETGEYFFVKLGSQDTITLPKRSFDYETLNSYLTQIATENNYPINRELNWKWK